MGHASCRIPGLFHNMSLQNEGNIVTVHSFFHVHNKHQYIIQLNYPGLLQSVSNSSEAKVIVTLISRRLLFVSSISSFSSANTSLCFCNSFLIELPPSLISFNSSSNLANEDCTFS